MRVAFEPAPASVTYFFSFCDSTLVACTASEFFGKKTLPSTHPARKKNNRWLALGCELEFATCELESMGSRIVRGGRIFLKRELKYAMRVGIWKCELGSLATRIVPSVRPTPYSWCFAPQNPKKVVKSLVYAQYLIDEVANTMKEWKTQTNSEAGVQRQCK